MIILLDQYLSRICRRGIFVFRFTRFGKYFNLFCIYSAYNLQFSNDYFFAQNLHPNLIIKHNNYFFANTINTFIEKIS